MSGKKFSPMRKKRKFRITDFLVLAVCISGAAYSINLFRLDLFSVTAARDEEPVGIMVIRNNIVQRRPADRNLWDRPQRYTYVFCGDLIRVAEVSAATLYMNGAHINVSENTLLRIQRPVHEEDSFQIHIEEGGVSIDVTDSQASIVLALAGHYIQAGPGAVLSASATDEGIELLVSEGTAFFFEEGVQTLEVSRGEIIAIDEAGRRFSDPAAAVTSPRPNARFLKSALQDALPVNFQWNRLYLLPNELLRLELAQDRNFSRIIHTIENLNDSADVYAAAGLWHWRLSLNENILSSGQFTVTEAAVPQTVSPITGGTLSFADAEDSFTVNFQWSQVPSSSYYIFQASQTADFSDVKITRQTRAAFLVDSSLDAGIWYWRVKPVFPPVYNGAASFSPAAFFNIQREQGMAVGEAAVVRLPEPVVVPQPQPIEISLQSPSDGAVLNTLPGLTIFAPQTLFTWNSDGQEVFSRFIVSRNGAPLADPQALEILNPAGQTVRLDTLAPGRWYWTVQVQSADGLLSSSPAHHFYVRHTPMPMLPAPGNRQPASGFRVGIELLRQRRDIVFSWAAVTGANAYIFALYEQTPLGRRLVLRTPPQSGTSWVLDVGLLNRGTFIWQVQAVTIDLNNVVQRRGLPAENTLVVDVPLPGPVSPQEPGILYGH